MKNEKFLTRAAFRLLALVLCLTASIPQMQAQTYTVAGTANGVLGTSNDWNVSAPDNDMTRYGNTTYYYLIKSGNLTYQNNWYGFKIVTNHSWNNASYPSDNYYYNVASSGNYTCVFVFNTNGNKVSLTGPFQTLTAVGNDANALGSEWTPNNNNNDLTSTDGGITYKLHKSNVTYTSSGNYLWKIVTNHVWNHDGIDMPYPLSDENVTYNIPSAGTYDLDFTFNTITQVLDVNLTQADTYVVAGVSSVFGANWDGTSSANTMAEGNNGTYTLSLTNVALTASTDYEYKIVKNGSNWIGDPNNNNENFKFAVTLNGTYDVTFTFDPTNNDCTVTCTLRNATGGETYTVAGSNTTILGSEWDIENTNNDMTLQGNGLYQLTKSGVVLGDNDLSCNFKVAVNHSWVTAYPTDNTSVTGFNGSGTYDIVFTYNPNNNEVTGVATKRVTTYDYTIYVRYKGDATPYMYLWDSSGDQLGSFPGTALTDANTFSTEVINGYTYYKYTVTGSEYTSMGMILNEGSSENQTSDLTVQPGTSYWTYGGGSIIYGPNAAADPAITTYYAATDIYNWTLDAGSLMTYNSSDGSYSKTFTGVSLTGGTDYGYKVFGADDGTNEGVWIGDAQGNNAIFTPAVSGTYNVTITLNSDGTVSHTLTLINAAPIYITGSSGLGLGWSHDNPTAMTYDQSTGYYTYIYQVTDSGTYNFVFANGMSDNWESFNAQYRIGPSGATDVSVTPNDNWNNTQMANGSNKSYSVKLNPGTVTITYDPANMRFKVDGHILTHNYTFYVLPSDHSTTPYMYLWGLGTDEAFHNDYPGTALTRTDEPLADGNYWYVLNVDLTAEFIHALVNGGTPQDISNADNTKTADITHIDPGTYYIYWTTTREDGQSYNDYILTNVPPTHPGGTLFMIGTYYYDKTQYSYDPNNGVQLKYDANSETYYLNNVNLAVNNTFCFTTNLSSNWENVDMRYGNGGPTYIEGENTTNYFEINENYINKKLNLDEWNENFGEFRITVPGIYNVLVNPEQKWVQLIKTDYYALTPMNVFLEQTPNVTMATDGNNFIQNPGTEYTTQIFGDGFWPLSAFNRAHGDGEWDPHDNGNHYPVTYIGDTTTVDGKTWWHWQVNASIAEIFFTRLNEPYQSSTVERKSGVLWLTWDEVDGETSMTDHSREYFEAAANALPTNAVVMEGHYYVYFINTVDWDNVYCYAWDNNPVTDGQGNPVLDDYGNPVIDNYFHDGYSRQMNDWPGQPCELVGIDPVTGYEVWRYDFGTIIGTDIPNGGIIFNDGNEYAETEAKEQTGDFEYINGAVYDYLGMVDGAYTLNNLIRTAAEEVRYTVSNDLLAVFYDPKAVTRIDYKNAYDEDVHEYITGALYAKDLNQYGEKSIMPDATYTDYVYQTCASNHTPGRSQVMIKRTTYDQSNWVKLVLSPNYDNRHEVVAPADRPNLEDYVGHIIPAGTLDVFMTDTINPTAHVLAIQMGETMSYEPNVYISSHFNDTVVFNYTHKDWQPDEYTGNYRTQPFITWNFDEEGQVTGGTANRRRVEDDPYYMYYVAPKPQEIAYITWVVYDNYNTDEAWPDYCKHTQWTGEDGWSYQPYTTPNPHVTPPADPGRFYAPMNWNRRTEIPGEAYDDLQYLAGDVLDKALGAWDPDYGPYSNGYMQYGAIKVNWSLFQEETPWWQIFTPGQAYKFMAIIRYARGSGYNPDPESGDIDDTANNFYYGPSIGYFEDGDENIYSDGHTVFNAPRRDDNEMSGYANMYFCGDYAHLNESKFIIFPIKASAQRSNGDGMGNVTAVKEVLSDVTSSRTVVGVSYYNLMGVKSDKPFDGINIVVTTYSDGSRSSKKILR